MAEGPLIDIGLPIALFIIMIGMGMTLRPLDFKDVAVYPKAMVVGTVAQIAVLPLVAFALIGLLSLPAAIAVGLVVIAACPGGTTSNVYAFVARGHVALSIVLTVLASLITIVTLPLVTNFALDLYLGADERVRLPVLQTIATLVVIVLVPVLIGMVIRARATAFAQRVENLVSLFGLLVLAALIAAIVIQTGDEIWDLLRVAGPAALLLNLAGMGIGLASGRLFRLRTTEAVTLATELGIKNGTLGLMITLTLLESSAMSIPSAVYSLFMFPLGFLMIAYGRRAVRQAAAA
ncbi:bile acid:sodium symporter family protein [Aquisalimonas asiatica]|uniref:Bile acid:Na+ symporter, BASS family n=1 Tax=Aquisalimonas asiatica TaxID=406100 RepID=A0A1H8RMB2_9GAMM|nr:bile acid:Na+ symporter, BASS family [Aquisalimonas asiatica]